MPKTFLTCCSISPCSLAFERKRRASSYDDVSRRL
jgi:hypothetical protein